VESCRSIDVNELHKAGCLRPGWSGIWKWTRDSKLVAWILLRAEAGHIVLSYRYRHNGGEWQDVREHIPIEYVSCRFGGRRPYFRCPGVRSGSTCGRRAAKVFAAGRYFLCRHCYHLGYESQRERVGDRARRRSQKIRIRLGGSPNMMLPFPDKPKGMHWSTYARLHAQAMALDMRSLRAVEGFLARVRMGLSSG
jgi:hypothetical protein